MDSYYMLLIVLIIAITIMYTVYQVADIFKEKYRNLDKIIKNNENCQIRITQESR